MDPYTAPDLRGGWDLPAAAKFLELQAALRARVVEQQEPSPFGVVFPVDDPELSLRRQSVALHPLVILPAAAEHDGVGGQPFAVLVHIQLILGFVYHDLQRARLRPFFGKGSVRVTTDGSRPRGMGECSKGACDHHASEQEDASHIRRLSYAYGLDIKPDACLSVDQAAPSDLR